MTACRRIPPTVGALLLVLASAAVTPALLAQDAAAYGEAFARTGSAWPDAGPRTGPGTASAVPPQPREAFSDRLEAMETASGPYAEGLAEPLADLARHFREAGDLEQALTYYNRALHNLRVNDGLYSERQMPLVREQLDLYRATGDLESLDGRYDYFFRLYGSGQPPYDEVRLRATLEYLRWQREAYRRGLRTGDHALLRLYEQTRDLTATVIADPSVGASWRRELALSQLRNLYLIVDRVEPLVELFGAASKRPFLGPDGQPKDFTRERLENIERTALARGRDLLEALLVSDTEADPVTRATLYRELGDWYQWNNSTQRAVEAYARGMAVLRDAAESELIAAWWGEPVELPDNGAFWQPPLPEETAATEVVARFSVSARGRATGIDIAFVDMDESSRSAAVRLRRELSATRFRPAFHGPLPLAVDGLERRYTVFP